MSKRWHVFVIACVAAGLLLRVYQLSAEGFADDEVHKWLAALRYLRGDFGGDDVEHPMLMKWLIALCIAICPRGWAPETLTRLPNAVAGAMTVLAVAWLGRALFGRMAGAIAAALTAASPALIGYQRVAKEDTLFGLFVLLLLLAIARRREKLSALALAGMLASKYYFFFLPLPLHLWRKPRRLALSALAMAAWLAVNWTPLFPSTWAYLVDHVKGRHVSTPTLYFMGSLYANLPLHVIDGVPWTYYFVFAAAKLTPLVLLLAVAGLAIAVKRRSPGHRMLLAWLLLSFASFTLLGAKYGRYFVSVMPGLFLLAGHAVAELWTGARRWVAVRHDSVPGALQQALAPIFAIVQAAPLALALAAFTGEAGATLALAPHSRLYVSPLAGGDANLDWLFPHCDYFDAGLREAVQAISSDAEPGAEIAAAVDLPVRFYARSDLRVTMLSDGDACVAGVPCYVIVQPGRIYLENREAIAALAARRPWAVERIHGHAAATVYRLEPGESPVQGASVARRSR